MKKTTKILLILILASFNCISQTEVQKYEIKDQLNLNRAEKTSRTIKTLYLQRQKRINKYLNAKNITDKSFIHKIYDVIDGKPVLRTTENIKAARLTGTDALQPNGGLGLDLEGEDYEVGVWDKNGVMLEHVEFDNAGTSRVSKGDMTFGYSGHATHVAGTIAASGIKSEARGMAAKALIISYDWNADDMEANEAALNGLLISNHSYGIPVFNDGAQVSSARRVGAYTENAYEWDLLPYTYEYYLPVISAGNDGEPENSNPLQPTYDKLMGNKTGKNLMIVANSTNTFYTSSGDFLTDPFINSSSSEGPTDDGRVKPDIAGMGTGLISSYFTSNEPNKNDIYATSTGTSMSAPNVAGSLILLQELNYNLYNSYLKNYELKNLAIHTAYDSSTSTQGPDPKFGWGILDARKSAELLLEKDSEMVIIDKMNLAENSSVVLNLSLLEEKDFKASIAWNDIPGLGLPDNYQGNDDLANDPTPTLINDLDIRLRNTSTDVEYYPWKLDISSASIPAIKGDNNVDNVEKIEVDQLPAGNYTLTVSHKNTLVNDSQDFSIIVTGITNYGTLSNSSFEIKSISFWPNPVKTNLNITSSEINFSKDVQVAVYDIVGREVMRLDDFESTNNLNIDMSSLSRGIYILNLNDGSRSLQKRIIKE